jgi:hypothetical protein
MGAYRDKKNASFRPDGQIRQRQLVSTLGPGAMVDLVDREVVIGGPKHRGYGKEQPVIALDNALLRRSLIPKLNHAVPMR